MVKKTALQVPGFCFAAVPAGIKYRHRPDVGLIIADRPCNCAGVFTTNRVRAPAVRLDKQRLKNNGLAQAIIVNSGNANTCVGDKGHQAALKITRALAKTLSIKNSLCLMSSTGVIGEPLPEHKITDKIPALVKAATPERLPDFARAIMTTDTRPKTASRTFSFNNKKVTLAAAAKGSGMIMPDMATMLAYVVTDARIDTNVLKKALRRASENSFNALTVDGDTSTSDTVIVMAGGKSGCNCNTGKAYSLFQHALDEICLELAESIAADGEGATRLVRILAKEAKTRKEADAIARRVANSPLVKTALHAADPNWGRIMAAAGSAGVPLDANKVSLRFQDPKGNHVQVVENGALSPRYSETKARRILGSKEVDVILGLGRGSEQRTVLTCDLSAEYIKINAEYRS
ncbi:MAG: bifunctional glutamate N-acetyltransferase/amino-acid acetyltransferase ArgJ [bacterium]